MSGRLVAVLDADVLVLSCDVLLCAFDHDLYRPVVTRRILDEVLRTLETDFSHIDVGAVRRRAGQGAGTLTRSTPTPRRRPPPRWPE